MRGKVCYLHNVAYAPGITPAHAGKSILRGYGVWSNTDHPRTCGEKCQPTNLSSAESGSPPHMRGKVKDEMNDLYKNKDHPRTCGEKSTASSEALITSGSPPHMRGKGLRYSCSSCRYGITPAHAGKSNKKKPRKIGEKDHPRTCGEKSSSIFFLRVLVGSPPHMRGKVSLTCAPSASYGITPAHAGKSICRGIMSTKIEDHPRTCGEKKVSYAEIRAWEGSPPHMRGKGLRYSCSSCRYGITPAHAGKSDSSNCQWDSY